MWLYIIIYILSLWCTPPPPYFDFQGRYGEVDELYTQAVMILLKTLGPVNQVAPVMLGDWARLVHAQVTSRVYLINSKPGSIHPQSDLNKFSGKRNCFTKLTLRRKVH